MRCGATNDAEALAEFELSTEFLVKSWRCKPHTQYQYTVIIPKGHTIHAYICIADDRHRECHNKQRQAKRDCVASNAMTIKRFLTLCVSRGGSQSAYAWCWCGGAVGAQSVYACCCY